MTNGALLNAFDIKRQVFATACAQFQALIDVDLTSVFDGQSNAAVLIDGLKNGQAQKFELTTELGWKAIQSALFNLDGVSEVSPKKVIKAFFLNSYIDETSYTSLIDCVDDRNKLSHLYDNAEFERIVNRFQHYAQVLNQISHTLNHL